MKQNNQSQSKRNWFGMLGGAVFAVAVMLCGCGKSQPAQTQQPIPEKCIGTFTGKTSPYRVLDKDGNVLRVSGNVVTTLLTEQTVVVSKDLVTIRSDDGNGKKSECKGAARLIHANPQEILIEVKEFSPPNILPACQICYGLNDGSIKLIQMEGGARPTTLCAVKTPEPNQVEQNTLPEICIGTFTGQTPAYSMKDKDGNLLRMNGNTIDVPAVNNTVVITKESVVIKQESGGKVVEGKGKARVVSANVGAVLIEAQVSFAPNSCPTYKIEYIAGGAIDMRQLEGGAPGTSLSRETVSTVDTKTAAPSTSPHRSSVLPVNNSSTKELDAIQVWTDYKKTEELTDQALLAKIALEAKDSDVCQAAVKNLTNQTMLAEIAGDLSPRAYRYLHEAAIEKLTDQTALAKVALGDGNSRESAIKKLTDQTVLAKIAVGGGQKYYRIKAIQNLTDQTVLAKIAAEDDEGDARLAAAKKLTDQTALAKIAVESGVWQVRQTAMKKLTDQTALAKVALGDEISNIRRGASEKLTDQTALAKIAVEDKDSDVRRAAIKNLTDQALLAKIAVEDKDGDVRLAAIKNLTDQTVLAKIAVENGVGQVRRTAVHNLTDQTLLAKIAVEDKDSHVRLAAAEKITDQTVLGKVALGDEIIDVRLAAAEKLTDQTVLAKIAVEDKDRDVRIVAVQKLNDKSVLAQIAVKDDNSQVRAVALNTLKNLR